MGTYLPGATVTDWLKASATLMLSQGMRPEAFVLHPDVRRLYMRELLAGRPGDWEWLEIDPECLPQRSLLWGGVPVRGDETVLPGVVGVQVA
jgi:hypothetical protein